MDSFSSLVEEEWESLKDLQSLTTGHNLSLMFADLSEDAALIMAATGDTEPDSNDRILAAKCKEQLCHFMSVSRKLGYFAVPAKRQPTSGATTYVVFQLLGFKPWKSKIHPTTDKVGY